jgi:hypothetical protein
MAVAEGVVRKGMLSSRLAFEFVLLLLVSVLLPLASPENWDGLFTGL